MYELTMKFTWKMEVSREQGFYFMVFFLVMFSLAIFRVVFRVGYIRVGLRRMFLVGNISVVFLVEVICGSVFGWLCFWLTWHFMLRFWLCCQSINQYA